MKRTAMFVSVIVILAILPHILCSPDAAGH